MSELIFNEEQFLSGNIFQFEERLKSQASRYTENGMILTTYFNQDVDRTTVDRGTGDVDELHGNKSPIRYNEIDGLPLNGFGQANPENNDEHQTEDIDVEGDALILPGTIVPRQYDLFVVKHMKMLAIFQVTTITYDSMRASGYYKIHYKLHSTEQETLNKIKNQVVNRYRVELDAIGTSLNPVIQKDDFIHRSQVQKMVAQMITSYRAMYYNSRHNCFLYHDPQTGMDLFDMCGNEFISRHSLMNHPNGTQVIMLCDKLQDSQFAMYYNNSVYSWLEMDAPDQMIRKFHYLLSSSDGYPYSSFYRWDDEVMVMLPLAVHQERINFQENAFFDSEQVQAFLDPETEPVNEYDKLIWRFIHKRDRISIWDVSLHTADALISCIRHIDTFLYTPIIIYIIRKILNAG